MTSEEFVRAVKIQTSDAAVHGTVAILEKRVGRKPREQDVRLSEWYTRISEADQQMVLLALKESAELAVFEFFCVLDGVAVIEDTPEKGDLELYFIKNSERTRVNLPAGEELHNIFNRLCEESPSSVVRNSDLASGDSGEASQIKTNLRLGDGMDIHHVPDKHSSTTLISDYDPKTAPAMVLGKSQHRKMPSPQHRNP
jgi:hypothetical protein